MIRKITPFLLFDDKAEEAARFYTSVFENSKMGEIHRMPDESVQIVHFEIAGQELIALNGGPQVPFTEAISLFVHCETQAEVDELWEKLSEGGEKRCCGWLRDKYGLCWQIIPNTLMEIIQGTDKAKVKRAYEAMLQMTKIETDELRRAIEG